MGAAVGGPVVFSAQMPGGLIPASFAQDANKEAAGGTATSATAPKGPQLLQFPGKDNNLLVLGDRPLVAETPEHMLDDDTTPTPKFFVRNNGHIPEMAAEPEKWKLAVEGEVNTKLGRPTRGGSPSHTSLAAGIRKATAPTKCTVSPFWPADSARLQSRHLALAPKQC